MPREDRLDLPQLDASAPDLHLVVGAAQALDGAVGTVAGRVPGAVQPLAGCDGPGHEALPRQLLPPPVPARHAGAADVELARHADGDRISPRIQDVGRGVGDRPSDRHRPVARPDLAGGGPDGRLRRPVHVPQGRAAAQEAVGEVPRQGLAAAENLEAAAAGPARLDQRAPRGRRRLDDGASRPRDQLRQAPRVGGRGATRDDQLAPGHERQEQLEGGDVEGDRGERQENVGGDEARSPPHRGQQVDDRAVRDLDALRPPRRARGVDDVGQVLGPDLGRRAGLAVALLQEHDAGVRPGERPAQGPLGEQCCRPRLVEDERQPRRREVRVERQVCATGFQNAEQGGEQVERPFGTDRDQRLRPHPDGAQARRHLPGAPVQLPVGPGLAVLGCRGDRVGQVAGLRLEPGVERDFAERRGPWRSRRGAGRSPSRTAAASRRARCRARRRRPRGSSSSGRPCGRPSGRRTGPCCRGSARPCRRAARRARGRGRTSPSRSSRPSASGPSPRGTGSTGGSTENRTWNSGWRPGSRFGCSSRTTRSNGTSLAASAPSTDVPHLQQVVVEPQVARRARPQREAVEEVAHEPLELGPPARVGDAADQDVVLPRVAVQEGLEGGEQRDVERDALAAAQRLQALDRARPRGRTSPWSRRR